MRRIFQTTARFVASDGTQSSLSDLLLFEVAAVPGVPFDDVVEVSNYVAALEHGLARIKDGFPLSNRLIRELHDVLMRRGRGSEKQPGEFRTSQNWLGGATPAQAVADGVIEVVENAVTTARRLADLVQHDRERVRGAGRLRRCKYTRRSSESR